MTADIVPLAENTLEFAERRYRELPPDQQLLVGAVIVSACVAQHITPPPFVVQLMNHARGMRVGRGIALKHFIGSIDDRLHGRGPYHVA